MFAIRSATVVLPVPGLPVKAICSVGGSEVSPTSWRARATKRNAAISRMRCLTGASPTRSRSSSAIGAPRSASACSAFRSTTSLAEPNAVADPEMLIVPHPVPQLSLLTPGSVDQPAHRDCKHARHSVWYGLATLLVQDGTRARRADAAQETTAAQFPILASNRRR